MKYSLVAFLLLILTGCELLESSDAPHVYLDTDRTSYQPGQDLVLTLTNFSGRTFTVGPDLFCDALLQRREKTTWKPIPIHGDGVCLDLGRVLRPGKEVVSRRELSDTLSAGEYRYMYALSEWEDGGRYRRFERVELYTRVFQVRTRFGV